MFDSAKAQVTGSAGLNSYFGSYEVEGNKLSIPGPIGSTMMAGPEPIMAQENKYLTALQTAESFSIKDDQLQVNYGQQILVFKHKQKTD
jgi:heat shock protein HslJ